MLKEMEYCNSHTLFISYQMATSVALCIEKNSKRGEKGLRTLPPGIFWNMGTNMTLASSNHSMSKREASSSSTSSQEDDKM